MSAWIPPRRSLWHSKRFFAILATPLLLSLSIGGIVYLASGRLTIGQGIYGRVFLHSGDCMPTTNPWSSCRTEAVSRGVFVRLPASQASMNFAYLENPTPLAASARSGWDGFYEVSLPPGNYSVFVEDLGQEYCRFSVADTPCEVVVPEGVVRFDLYADHAAY